jgi:hypothetical protein
MNGRRCTRCGTWYTVEEVASGQAFRTTPRRRMHLATEALASICRPCEETAQDASKSSYRWGAKANATTAGHAVRLRSPRTGPHCEAWYDPDLTKETLINRYGWAQAQIMHDASFKYGNGCDYCHHPYVDMGHGLADITLDIFDPRLPPDYGTNTRWCCMTCQRRKGLLTPEHWAVKQRVYRQWETHRALSPEARGMLF